MINRVKHRVEHLRSEPEHVRQRTVLLMTGAGGIIAVLLWLVVVLPIQMGILNNRDDVDNNVQPTNAPLANEQIEVVSSPQARVGGIQDEGSGQPLFASPTLSPTPTSTEERLNSLEEESSSSPTPSELPSSRPVQTQGAGFQVLE